MVDSVFLESSGCECDVTLDTWLKDALPMLPGVVRSVAARELVLTARHFFERTLAWRAVIEDINAVAGDKQYWQSPWDEFSNVIYVFGVAFKGNTLQPLVNKPMDATVQRTNLPTHFYTLNPPDSFYLYPQLETAQADAIDAWVALTPKVSVEHLPRIAFIKFYDALLDGLLARLLAHPNKPYTDMGQARERRISYSAAIATYKAEAKQGFVNGQEWMFPAGWRVGHSRRR